MSATKYKNNINSKNSGAIVAHQSQLVEKNQKAVKLSQKAVELSQKIDDLSSLVEKKRESFFNDLLNQYSDKEIAEEIAKKYDIATINLFKYDLKPSILKKIPRKICEKYKLVPVFHIEDVLVVATVDPGNLQAKEDISNVISSTVQYMVAEYQQLQFIFNKYYENKNQKQIQSLIKNLSVVKPEAKIIEDVESNIKIKNDPIVQMIDALIERGVEYKCSDIHIETYGTKNRIRFRVDGKLISNQEFSSHFVHRISNRIKMLSKLDIAEKRLPQDGRLNKLVNGKIINFRVSTIPVTGGEKIVLRILDTSNLGTDLDDLNMSPTNLNKFKKYLNLSQGLILMTGPTGSGKTTTIYSGLRYLNKSDVNICTVEDPVEYKIYGINQVQVDAKINLSFSRVLRAFLRQDPNIILIGEIRDIETANISYKAAATGHLVLSTLHTNDAVSSVVRLMDMGVPNYSVAESTSLVVAQRLLRVLCSECKINSNIDINTLIQLGCSKSEAEEMKPTVMKIGTDQNCVVCNGTGYQGRRPVFEVLEMTSACKKGVFQGLSSLELKKIAIQKDNLQTLRKSALELLGNGVTSMEEVLHETIKDIL